MEKLKFKKLNIIENNEDGTTTTIESNAVLPTKAHPTDAGYDLTATRLTQELDEAGKVILVYHTDLAVQIPEGYVGLLLMRSSGSKKSIMLANCVGVIDSGYMGELMMKFKITTDALPIVYQLGERIGQLVIVPCYQAETELVEELEETIRGEGGFGSTNIEEDEHNDGQSDSGDCKVPEHNR